ncbi:ferrous iron transport protein B [Phocaeicola vulgatus]|uniref:ferrous iron transport protein B n=2 Tax=Phocaeicola vulgatus TaxID=821 RepID=UPI0020302018|nr:ferrous iron transport protein B [Phocaeicola vulgatus]MCM1610381.1 ferrous iron transport protein B [Phocaeicola vulgatus]MCM1675010.1 ferrous iron transport protein B [Phocaeicola vulgatus]MCM1679113.1 ferrous iron transport protein B [Phocaeicola vulgatus]MCM1802774.1 ferrous iron transport protein B [Phocaeicola vulgatus]MCM1836558.1 ferrous iron transport protein B [Phocaeicola vulgatus]
MRLSELRTGEKGVIVKVLGHGGFRKRIVEMGFIKGKTVEVILNAPLKDPIKYRLLGYEISLRRQEADMIEVVSEQEARTMQNPYHGSITEDVPVSESELVALAKGKRRTINVALVGNPNCGKTSLFNIASGAHEHVGNYSGVTVDAKEGFFDFQGYHFRIVDLPGTYSLSAYTPEELYVRKHIIEETPDVIINVADSSNLERNFYLTTQLIDMNVRMVIALNMYDELESSGNKLDYIKLSQLIGVPMIPTVCRRGEGIDQLFHVIIGIYEGGDFLSQKGEIRSEILEDLRDWHKTYVPDHEFGSHKEEEDARPRGYMRHIHINHGPELERSIEEVKKAISQNEDIRHKYSTRFLSIKLLENDKEIENFISTLPNGKEIIAIRNKETLRIRKVMNEDSEQAITDAKYGFITGALKETFTDNHLEKEQTTRVIDSIVTHRIWGYPIFFLFLYIMFEGTFVLGDYPMQGIEWLVDQLGNLIRNNMTEGPLKDLLIDGIIGGVGGVIVFLPNILILYFFISILEDSGYMARTAFIMDKIMHRMGLHGKSFIPLIMGFGCNVPAIMATRTIEDRKSRLITMLVNPLMSCSARLPIYLVMIGAFFPNCASFMLLCIYTAGILLAVIMARIFSKFLVKGEDSPFVMELPPYRMPTSKSIMRHTWEKGAQYLKKMGGIIMIASIIIWFLGYYPQHDAYESVAEQQKNSYIGQIGKAIEPVIKPLGFDWKLGIGLISGVGAKELVVSTLGVLYTNEGDVENVNLSNRIPITPLVALAYMLFVLIYFPCIATFAAIKQESGSWKWAIFTAGYTTGLAWLIAFTVFQIGSLIV